jgi:RND family efflux transporter MFP subunit
MNIRAALSHCMCFGMALALAACGKHDEGGAHGAGGGPPPVSVAAVVKRDVQEFDEFTARLEAPDTVDIRARVAGTLEASAFPRGPAGEQGRSAVHHRSASLRRRGGARRSATGLGPHPGELNKIELARAERLVAVRGVSQQELDQLKAALATSQSSVKAAEAALVQARLNLEFTRITAPVSGRTSRANVTVGNLVNIGDPILTTLVSTDRIYAYFDASEALYLKYMRAARDGTRPSSRDSRTRCASASPTRKATRTRARWTSSTTASTRPPPPRRAVFDNKDGLYTPGLFARLQLVGSGTYSATLVPDRAITTDQTRKVVLVVGKNNIVEPREVKPGALIDGMRVVSGVKAGELVIVDGLLRLPGAPVTPQVVKVDEHGMPIAPPAGAAPAAKG